ncbi:hypothetical protein ACLMJK_001108 [Lecanora helva]
MLTSTLLALAGSFSAAWAQTYQGFNYGSTNTDNSPMTEQQYQNDFTTAQNLVGTSGFTSARLYTMIQAGTTNTPTEAIQAAINTKTSLLLGLWGSGGQTGLDNEIAALKSAIGQYGTAFTDLIVGISVGSEDLYRISPTGIENMSGIGAGPDVISNYIGQVRSAISGTAAGSKPVGHVDTWTAYVNGSNDAVISASDFIGMDAYPYFQTTMANSIDDGYSLFFAAYDATVNAAGGKPVWVTETGWPVSGPTENQAVPSLQNAKTYWDAVGCARLFGKINTWWYTLQDAFPTTPSPSFGIVGSTLSDTPLYDLSCSDASTSTSASRSTGSIAAESSGEAISQQAGAIPATAKIGAGSEAAGQVGSATGSGAGSSASVAPAQSSAAGGGAAPVQSSAVAGGHAPIQSQPGAGSAEQSQASASLGPQSGSSGAAHPENTVVSTDAVTITSCPAGCPKETQTPEETQTPKETQTQTQPTANAASIPSTFITKTSILSAASPATATASSCPASLNGNYEFPHLIVPINKDQPDVAGGTSFNGTISPSISSIFNFDIPSSDAGKTCTLVFFLPTQNELTTSAFTLSGSGGFNAASLKTPATESTTYNNASPVLLELGGPSSVTPGNEYVVYSGECAAGSRIPIKISATGDLSLNYFQDFNPAPIGFYVTVC